MIKFILKILQYIFIVCLLGYGIIYVSVLFYPGKMLGNATEYELWKYKKQLINTTYSQSKNIIIGDSRVMTGLNPVVIKHNIINLSLSGTTPFEGCATLKQFLQHNKIDTLIIGYGIFHYIESDVLEKWTLLYQFNTIQEVNSLENVERIKHITLDNQSPGLQLYLGRKATYYHSPINLRQTFIENLKQSDYKLFIIKQLKETIGFSNLTTADSAAGTNTEVEIALKAKKFIPNPVILSYLDSISLIVKNNNIKTFLLIPPINYASYKMLTSTLFWKQFSNFLHDLQIKYPFVKIEWKNAYLPNTYFADNSHLNRKGADFLSEYVRDSIMENVKKPAIINQNLNTRKSIF